MPALCYCLLQIIGEEAPFHFEHPYLSDTIGLKLLLRLLWLHHGDTAELLEWYIRNKQQVTEGQKGNFLEVQELFSQLL